MKEGYYITADGEKVILKSEKIINVSYQNIVELVIPDGVKWVYCYNNQLTELNLPKGVEWVSCENNQLTELKLSEGVKWVYCWNNQLTELILPDGVKEVRCDYIPNVEAPDGCNVNMEI